MGKNTYDITFSFFCVQPVCFSEIAMKKFYTKKTKIENIEQISSSTKPEWLNYFTRSYSVYDTFFVIELDEIDKEILKEELKNDYLVNNKHSLFKNFIQEKTNFFLLYDYKLMTFTLVYKIVFEFNESKIKKLLKCNSEISTQIKNGEKYKIDLYNTIRNILVREDKCSQVSKWTKKIEEIALNKIYYIVNSLYDAEVDENNIYIDYNTGNITNLVYNNDITESDFNEIKGKIIKTNDFAERVKNEYDPIKIRGEKAYYFNGRFHTIFLKSKNGEYRYMPIQFHIQYVWFYLSTIYDLIEKMNYEILSSTSSKIISTQIDIIDSIINKMQMLYIFNENFKRAIETDNKQIYSVIEEYWNVESFLESSKQYIDNFKDYLNRLYSKQNARNEGKQSQILFFISMLQLITLISVWNDYISTISEKNIESVDEVIKFFGSLDNLQTFNLILPLIILIFIIIILIYGFTHRD
ncbi:MAG: hypothetical protein ACQEQF_12010 [Bacillota bacterium]